MKMKKNVATAIISGALVGCLAIGGTFAYLTANSGKVVNTFSGAADLNVTISETAQPSANGTYKISETSQADKQADGSYATGEKADGAEGGITYTNVVPGAQVNKDVDIHVKQNDTNSYVFVKIEGLDNANLEATTLQTVDGTWVKADGTTGQDGVYALTVSGSLDELKVIDSTAGDVTLNLFNTINVKSDLAQVVELGNITVTAKTIQANGVTSQDALDNINF